MSDGDRDPERVNRRYGRENTRCGMVKNEERRRIGNGGERACPTVAMMG
jgi:hypothetical protein